MSWALTATAAAARCQTGPLGAAALQWPRLHCWCVLAIPMHLGPQAIRVRVDGACRRRAGPNQRCGPGIQCLILGSRGCGASCDARLVRPKPLGRLKRLSSDVDSCRPLLPRTPGSPPRAVTPSGKAASELRLWTLFFFCRPPSRPSALATAANGSPRRPESLRELQLSPHASRKPKKHCAENPPRSYL